MKKSAVNTIYYYPSTAAKELDIKYSDMTDWLSITISYSNSNDKHISVYSDSDEVSGFDSFDTTGRVMRIKSFNLSSGVDADIFLILENGSVMRVNDNYNGLETYKELSDYKISDIVSMKMKAGEGYSFDVILKDGSEKVIKK